MNKLDEMKNLVVDQTNWALRSAFISLMAAGAYGLDTFVYRFEDLSAPISAGALYDALCMAFFICSALLAFALLFSVLITIFKVLKLQRSLKA